MDYYRQVVDETYPMKLNNFLQASSSSSSWSCNDSMESLSLSLSLSLCKSSRLHSVFARNRCILVFVSQPRFVCPCVHVRTSLMSSSLLHQHCSACLVSLTWMVCEMGGKWSYRSWFVQNNTERSWIFPIKRFLKACRQVVQPYSSTDTDCVMSLCVSVLRVLVTDFLVSIFHLRW